jgi:hypothetical protein
MSERIAIFGSKLGLVQQHYERAPAGTGEGFIEAKTAMDNSRRAFSLFAGVADFKDLLPKFKKPLAFTVEFSTETKLDEKMMDLAKEYAVETDSLIKMWEMYDDGWTSESNMKDRFATSLNTFTVHYSKAALHLLDRAINFVRTNKDKIREHLLDRRLHEDNEREAICDRERAIEQGREPMSGMVDPDPIVAAPAAAAAAAAAADVKVDNHPMAAGAAAAAAAPVPMDVSVDAPSAGPRRSGRIAKRKPKELRRSKRISCKRPKTSS